jgi:hypothetical protein
VYSRSPWPTRRSPRDVAAPRACPILGRREHGVGGVDEYLRLGSRQFAGLHVGLHLVDEGTHLAAKGVEVAGAEAGRGVGQLGDQSPISPS